MIEPCDVRVLARFRPLSTSEVESTDGEARVCAQFHPGNAVAVHVTGDLSAHRFTFDQIFPPEASQSEVYSAAGRPMVDDLFQGYNSTVLVYGQTGSGKTHTMMGGDDDWGIVPRVTADIFDRIAKSGNEDSKQYEITVSYVEVYMEKIRDLLDVSKTNLQIHEAKGGAMIVGGATEINAGALVDVCRVLVEGARNRKVATTRMNESSSRSHSILCLTLTQRDTATLEQRLSKLFLVDLAGSEKVGKTHAQGQQLEEAKLINKSLSTLGLVINALTDSKAKYIPYRDSKLTRLLQDSLGGNSKTCLVMCCSPSVFNDLETLCTLRFGQRAKTIKNCAKVNRVYTVEELRILVREANETLDALRKGTGAGDIPAGDMGAAVDVAKAKAMLAEGLATHSDRQQMHKAAAEDSVVMRAKLSGIIRACEEDARAATLEAAEWRKSLQAMSWPDGADAMAEEETEMSSSLEMSIRTNEGHALAIEGHRRTVLAVVADAQTVQCGGGGGGVPMLAPDAGPLDPMTALLRGPSDARLLGMPATAPFAPLLGVTGLKPTGTTVAEVRAEVALLEDILSDPGTVPTATLDALRAEWDSCLPNAVVKQLQVPTRKGVEGTRALRAMYRKTRNGAMSHCQGYCDRRHDVLAQQTLELQSSVTLLRREAVTMGFEISVMQSKLSLRNDRIENTKKALKQLGQQRADVLRAFDHNRCMLHEQRKMIERDTESWRAQSEAAGAIISHAPSMGGMSPGGAVTGRIVRSLRGGTA